MTPEITPGLLVLHGNRAELLGEAVFEWLRRQPLGPLEEEIFLVQSNGMAEWLKMALASQAGILAATRVELPGRFLWRAYRQVLGRAAVPTESVLDKQPLTWRLMHSLPGLLAQPGFAPLAGFLRAGDADRRWQLAQRLADLFDQYQVYRSDWLAAWAAGHDTLPRSTEQAAADAPALPPDQRWQAALWRALLLPLSPADRAATRPQLQQRFLATLAALAAAPAGSTALPALPRRVVLFGMAHLPLQILQALAALSAHCQVLLAVPNPCRYHWADTIDGRELLRQAQRRQPLRAGLDLAALPLDAMHAHAHPLLAAWGRQGRDFVRQLDAFDEGLLARQRFAPNQVDLFDDGPGANLLQQVQASIRDLLPLAEHAHPAPDAADRSIVFHIAHSAQREVEVLHDQLLTLLAQPPGGAPLNPRDIVVMVPDISRFAPAIRAVFGQHPRSDARFIPFDIADLPERGQHPLLLALDWLLRLPQQRCRLSELHDLLDVPAIATRFGLQAADLPRLARWTEGAGIRWGLGPAQRADLGLAACGAQNTWLFGLRRWLLGYAVGATDSGFAGIQPYAEVAGLEAALAGSLASLVDALLAWWAVARTPATPVQWAERCRALLTAFISATDEPERALLAALQTALAAWLAACSAAGFNAPLPLSVAREAWLAGLDAPGLTRRFRAGGVTFCTLLPMRAIPFEVVCLLGMNDGDYPRSSPRSDFDLMGLAGQARPGDRSRRDDDRQLMLEALLSARRVLSVSWTGRSARDNSAQPPSVLVSQLRDYLAAGWPGGGVDGGVDSVTGGVLAGVLASRTTVHALQPFSRRYFEAPVEPPVAPADAQIGPASHTVDAAGQPLFTHAREWRAAHATPPAESSARPPDSPVAAWAPDPTVPLTLQALAAFLRNPVKAFFRTRLDVVFDDDAAVADDDEPFALGGLAEYGLLDEMLRETLRATTDAATADAAAGGALAVAADLHRSVTAQVARLLRAGRLPMAEQGRRSAQHLAETALPMLAQWQALQARYPLAAPQQPLRFAHAGVQVEDWLDGLRCAVALTDRPAQPAQPDPCDPPDLPAPAARSDPSDPPVWLQLLPSALWDPKKRVLRPHRLIDAWVKTLLASACGCPVQGLIVARDATVTVSPLPQHQAQALLQDLLQAWRDGMASPLPLASRTGLALLAGVNDVAAVYDGAAYSRDGAAADPGEVQDACLARLYPTFDALAADGRFARLAQHLLGPLLHWAQSAASVALHATPNTAAAAAAADADTAAADADD